MYLNILIPMAGESSRFGYKFKPFLFLDNKRFIEHCIDSFLPYNSIINSYTFIVTKKQEKDHDIKSTLEKIFFNIKDKTTIITIEKKTTGPYQTIIKGLNKVKVLDNLIICDCDHHINISPIIETIKNSEKKDIIIPIWEKYVKKKK